MTTQYVWFLIFGITAYVIVTDPNVARAFDYVLRLANNNIRHHWWWITHNPRNPVVKYLIYRRSLRLAEELMQQINNDKEKE